jgi:Ca-activated chloride channel family protein
MMEPWRFTLLGYSAGFGVPLGLLLLLPALALGAFGAYVALRRSSGLRDVVAPKLLARLAPNAAPRRHAVRAGLTSLGLLLFALALAQPQCGSHSELTKKRGIDVAVVLDGSRSMLARDVKPNRLERAKLELITLLEALKGDRVSIIAFAGEAYVQCPLTSDYAAAKMFLRAVDPEQMPQGGSDVGGGLELALRTLENAQRGAKERVVVLLTDGEDLAGNAKEAAEALGKAGVRVFAVGIGSETGEPIPVQNEKGEHVGYKRDARGHTVLTRLDKKGLEEIASLTGGELFYRPHGVAMSDVAERIDRLQKSELESRVTVRYEQRFQAYAFPGLGFLLAAMVMRLWRRPS